jgi:hypothetical protein
MTLAFLLWNENVRLQTAAVLTQVSTATEIGIWPKLLEYGLSFALLAYFSYYIRQESKSRLKEKDDLIAAQKTDYETRLEKLGALSLAHEAELKTTIKLQAEKIEQFYDLRDKENKVFYNTMIATVDTLQKLKGVIVKSPKQAEADSLQLEDVKGKLEELLNKLNG